MGPQQPVESGAWSPSTFDDTEMGSHRDREAAAEDAKPQCQTPKEPAVDRTPPLLEGGLSLIDHF